MLDAGKLVIATQPFANVFPYVVTILLHEQHVSIPANADLPKFQVAGLGATCLFQKFYGAIVVRRMVAGFSRHRKDRQRCQIRKFPRARICCLQDAIDGRVVAILVRWWDRLPYKVSERIVHWRRVLQGDIRQAPLSSRAGPENCLLERWPSWLQEDEALCEIWAGIGN